MKFFSYVFIISGIMTLLYFGGFTDLPTGNALALLITGGVGDILSSPIWTMISSFLILAGTGGAIIAGLFGRNIDSTLLKGSFVAWFSSMFIIDLLWLYDKLKGQGDFYVIIAGLIFVPLIVGFVISASEFWTGND